MRRRSLVAALPVGLVALGACVRDDPGADTPPAASPVQDPTPVVRGEQAPVVDPAELRLPLEMTPMVVVDPGWTSTPLELDGIFLGYRDDQDQLRYIAVDQDGTILWEADRPLSCTGFTLTRSAEDTPVAVLADLAPAEDAVAAMTLTAYDLRTADEVWGPVDAPGPQAGVGLVFAAPSDAPMGETGPRSALSGSTGGVTLVDADLADGRILAEHLGTILCTEGAELLALSIEGEELWRLPMPTGIDPLRARVLGAIDTNTSFAVIADQESAGVVLDLSQGSVIADEALRVARDHVLEITVVASGSTVRGLDIDGVEQWTHDDPEELDLISAGERLAYAVRRGEGTLVVLDTNRGLMVNPYDVDLEGPLAVPEVFSAETAAAVRIEEKRCLVTTAFDENYGLRE